MDRRIHTRRSHLPTRGRDLECGGYSHLYVFGTAGEGYAVDDAQFEHVARVFADEMRTAGAEPMVGIISLSTTTNLAMGQRYFEAGRARDLEIRQPMPAPPMIFSPISRNTTPISVP